MGTVKEIKSLEKLIYKLIRGEVLSELEKNKIDNIIENHEGYFD